MKLHTIALMGISLLAIVQSNNINAQDAPKQNSTDTKPALFAGNGDYRTWSFGLHAGAMAPFSASGGRNDFSKWQATLGYGVYIKKQVSHVVGIQLDVMKGTLKANNDKLWAGAPPVSPYKSFETNINYTASLSAVVTLGSINWSQLRTSIQPYVSIGGGAINFNPTVVTSGGTSIDVKPVGSFTEFYVPAGLGIKANLSKSVNLDLGYTMGFVDADNLDGYFKAPYVSDKFSYAHIGLEFALGNKEKPQLATHNAPAQLNGNMNRADDALRASLAASEERYNQRLAEIADMKDQLNKMKMDSDKDGVSDYFDKCANTPYNVKVDGAGCALPVPVPAKDTTIIRNNTYIITGEDRKIVDEAFRNLEFDFGKSTIRERSFPYLNKVADLLIQKGISLKLAGHTDNVGSDKANMNLSKDRAESLKNYFTNKGVNASRIEAVGYGESQPIATNKTAAGRQKNRRVEFTIY
ncbi:MAG: OmpA family protein [Sediminibacterium sp.]|nr:OmpA family protein [Sediminibacterium sp.]